jgi:hypothetical protein
MPTLKSRPANKVHITSMAARIADTTPTPTIVRRLAAQPPASNIAANAIVSKVIGHGLNN